MFEDFLNAFQNFIRNKTRTILSLLGVIIGVASVIVITSMGEASTKDIEKSMGTAGLDVVSVSSGFMMRRGQNRQLTFNDSFREEMFEEIRNIKKVWYKNDMNATITYEENSMSTNCTAIETGYLEIYDMELEEGEFFTVTDNEEGAQKIILSHDTAESLFPAGDAVGKMILVVNGKITFGFTVTGVLKENSVTMESGSAYVPRGWYAKKVRPNPTAASIMVQATSMEKATVLAEEIEAWCETKAGTENVVNVMSMQTMMDRMSEVTESLSLMLSAIAAISLLVGGIGIMNIMIVTVTERKQEIGIRKALGATPFFITRQFLVESASITLVGGLFGVIFGIVVSLAVEYVKKQSYIINTNACIIAFVFSVVVGIVFGLSPAIKAAKLDPVAALSGE